MGYLRLVLELPVLHIEPIFINVVLIVRLANLYLRFQNCPHQFNLFHSLICTKNLLALAAWDLALSWRTIPLAKLLNCACSLGFMPPLVKINIINRIDFLQSQFQISLQLDGSLSKPVQPHQLSFQQTLRQEKLWIR